MKNANKPAMPVNLDGHEWQVPTDFDGLTKREMFAMHAMQAMLTSKFVVDFNGDSLPDENDTLCERAVHYADALLKELEK